MSDDLWRYGLLHNFGRYNKEVCAETNLQDRNIFTIGRIGSDMVSLDKGMCIPVIDIRDCQIKPLPLDEILGWTVKEQKKEGRVTYTLTRLHSRTKLWQVEYLANSRIPQKNYLAKKENINRIIGIQLYDKNDNSLKLTFQTYTAPEGYKGLKPRVSSSVDFVSNTDIHPDKLRVYGPYVKEGKQCFYDEHCIYEWSTEGVMLKYAESLPVWLRIDAKTVYSYEEFFEIMKQMQTSRSSQLVKTTMFESVWEQTHKMRDIDMGYDYRKFGAYLQRNLWTVGG